MNKYMILSIRVNDVPVYGEIEADNIRDCIYQIVGFLFDQKTYDEAVDTWLGFKQNQVLSHTKYLKDGTLERHTIWKNLRTVLYAMEGYGIVWRCEPKYSIWYKITSKERVNFFDKSLVTTTTKKKTNKKKK